MGERGGWAGSAGPRRDRGATALGYALLVGLIGIAGIGAVTRVGDGVVDLFGGVANTMDDAAGVPSCGDPGEASFGFSGGLQSHTVRPSQARCQFTITVVGASGGGGEGAGDGSSGGGNGARVVLTFTPGAAGRFSLLVGEAGRHASAQPTFGGGGAGLEDIPEDIDRQASGSGGGASALRWLPEDGGARVLAVAGGGGGGSDGGYAPGCDENDNGADGATCGGEGSNGGTAGTGQGSGVGGAAGLGNEGNGRDGGAGGSSSVEAGTAEPGDAATTQPGGGGSAYAAFAISGGGAGANCTDAGAGGGGGYGGGGGGGCSPGDGHAGGGGGSWAAEDVNARFSSADNAPEPYRDGEAGSIMLRWQ